MLIELFRLTEKNYIKISARIRKWLPMKRYSSIHEEQKVHNKYYEFCTANPLS